MDEQKFEKTLKDAKSFSILVLVLALIMLGIKLYSNVFNGFGLIIAILQIVLLIVSIVGYNKKMIYGPVCGIVVSILMIISAGIVDIILGIAYLIECVNLIKYMK